MDIQAEKISLVQQILSLQKESIIRKLKQVLETETEDIDPDTGMAISEYLTKIEEGEQDIREGNIISHEQVVENLKSWRERRR